MSATWNGEAHVSPAMLRRVAVASCIGTTVEWYDFFIYATASSLLFPQLFFPSDNPTVAIVASLTTFGVGYVQPV